MKRESPGGAAFAEPPRKRPLMTDALGRPRFRGCDSIKSYEMLGKLGEGTFGEVHKARHIVNGKLVALKKILMHNSKEEGFPITALREIKILKMLSHPNIIELNTMVVERRKDRVPGRGNLYMVTPYMEHDLAGLLENRDVEFSDALIKCYMLQLLEGTKYLHETHVLHRDMKAANLLIDNRGVLKIADFGLARIFEESVPVPGRGGGRAQREYTNCVVTRWYRPPELLLGEKKYTSAIDLWGVGCVFAEMYKRKPILQGNSDMDQLVRIFNLCGLPNQISMPGCDRLPGWDSVRNLYAKRTLESQHSSMGSSGVALLSQLLKLDPVRRINAVDALKHEYFKTDPLPLEPGDVPRFNDSHELDGKKNRHKGPPPAPAGGSVGVGQNGAKAGEIPWQNGGPVGGRRPQEWSNGGGRHHGRPYDRPPPPDSRVPQNHRGMPGPPEHRPAWSRPSSHPSESQPPPYREANLPPRPPPSVMDRERGPPRMNSRPPGAPNLDTYIPPYSSGGDDRRRDIGRDRAWDRDRGGSRERSDWRDRGYSGGPGRSSSRDRPRDLSREPPPAYRY